MDKYYHEFDCPYCNQTVGDDLMKHISDWDAEERSGMGNETEYVIGPYDYCCPECEKWLTISGSIWEYPEGAINHEEIKINPLDNIEDETEEIEEYEK